MTTNPESTSAGWYILGGILVIAVVYVVYRYARGGRGGEASLREAPERQGNLLSKTPDGGGEVPENPYPAVSEALSVKIKYFAGSMNALMDIANSPDLSFAEITFDNIEQTIGVHGSEEVKKWYFSFGKDRKQWDEALYKDKANEMMKVLMGCGIRLSGDRTVLWNEEASMKYNPLAPVADGQECDVAAPCWTYKGDVFEKGLVRPR